MRHNVWEERLQKLIVHPSFLRAIKLKVDDHEISWWGVTLGPLWTPNQPRTKYFSEPFFSLQLRWDSYFGPLDYEADALTTRPWGQEKCCQKIFMYLLISLFSVKKQRQSWKSMLARVRESENQDLYLKFTKSQKQAVTIFHKSSMLSILPLIVKIQLKLSLVMQLQLFYLIRKEGWFAISPLK